MKYFAISMAVLFCMLFALEQASAIKCIQKVYTKEVPQNLTGTDCPASSSVCSRGQAKKDGVKTFVLSCGGNETEGCMKDKEVSSYGKGTLCFCKGDHCNSGSLGQASFVVLTVAFIAAMIFRY